MSRRENDRPVEHAADEIVIDSADVERAAELAERRHPADSRREKAMDAGDGEMLIVPPEE